MQGATTSNGTGEWYRSLAQQAYYVVYYLEDGTTAEYYGLFAAKKRMRYTVRT